MGWQQKKSVRQSFKVGLGSRFSIFFFKDFLKLIVEGYPQERDRESLNCLAIRGRGEAVGPRNWENADCDDKLGFICERPFV